jgi:hypothetical protein
VSREILEDPESERTVQQLERLVRVHVARLLRARVGGSVVLELQVERIGVAAARVTRRSHIRVTEYPLTENPG